MEVMRERIATLDQIANYVGEYFSKEWVQHNVLRLTEEEIQQMKKQIDGEETSEPEEKPQEEPQEEPPVGGQKHSIDINVKGNNNE
jgi:tRNA A37 methylthiotransferase MiaB